MAGVVKFAVLTRMRRSEICNLKWRRVTLYQPCEIEINEGLYGLIDVRIEVGAETKTGDEARVSIVPQCYKLLTELLKERKSEYVFTSPTFMTKLYPWWVSDRFRQYRRLDGTKSEIHFHCLRHTCAFWLVKTGSELKVIQEVMRHSTVKQKLRCAHLQPATVASKTITAFKSIEF